MNNLRNLRKEMGLSIPELHRRTGIPTRTLENWDAEKRTPDTYHRIVSLAKVLRCTPDDLMTKVEPCTYNGKPADVYLRDVEGGVSLKVFVEDDVMEQTTIKRWQALELLELLRESSEIAVYKSLFQKHKTDV